MTTPRANLVVIGQVVVAARMDGLETAEAIGIAVGVIVSSGTEREVRDAASAGARVIREPEAAIVPGLHDFHLHLVGMARARSIVDLSGCRDFDELVERVRPAAAALPPGAWLRGAGWAETTLDAHRVSVLEVAVQGHPALLESHDRHSAWASAPALQIVGASADTPDPHGGRFERAPSGAPNGILRESAADLIDDAAGRLTGHGLGSAIGEVVDELLGLGVTGATDAGDATAANGIGPYAEFGDSFSNLAEHHASVDGRLRLNVDLPADAMEHASRLELQSGVRLPDSRTLCVGWAKHYADGALGSRTAALFAPYTCDPGDAGILRTSPDELDELVAAARSARIGLAIHAIGDRAVAMVLDAFERGEPRVPGSQSPLNRIEHAQLVRAQDRPRFAALGVVASLQPAHCPSDREAAELCWADRLADAYAWRSLAAAGAHLAFGSDAPIETPNPWIGLFASVHRRFPGEGTADWRLEEALSAVQALASYTLGPAQAAGRGDAGHLRLGALADLAVLDVDLPTLLAADERAARARALLTMVGGREVFRR
jgi:predicted amidohydrolase YtcJ